MKEITYTILVLVGIYLLIVALLFIFQRKLIYIPVPIDPAFSADEITVDNNGIELHGWVLHPGKPRAVIYFGGNSESITDRAEYFDSLFSDYSVYLVNYRGYGQSQGQPSEAALYADALAIYDRIRPQHDSITAYGRSLGSGVAVYLASQRPIDKLILLTPFDSIAAVAQSVYPLFPVRYLVRDRFDSATLAREIDTPVLIASAELDRVIGLQHTLALRQEFSRAKVDYVQIKGAAHNDITEYSQYHESVARFITEN
jgi:pimeloyl-ACP methyl ester carboxylesterase